MPNQTDMEALGFAFPTGVDRIRNGDDVIRKNAVAAYTVGWHRGGLPAGSDLNEFTDQGGWSVLTQGAAKTMKNIPPRRDALSRAKLNVTTNQNGNVRQDWIVMPGYGGLPLTMTRYRDDLGKWTEWRRSDALADYRGIDSGDLRELGPGTYTIASSKTGAAIANKPNLPGANGAAIVEVLQDLVTGQKLIRWSSRQAADSDASIVAQTQQDTAGTWSPWRRIDGGGQSGGAASGTQISQVAAIERIGFTRALLRVSTETAPVWAWAGREGTQLVTPTHEGSGEACHPSVLYFPDGWNGWEYWMAMTPYPTSAEAHEDPNLLVSHDGTSWQVPPGVSNPLDDNPGRPGPHNSDTNLAQAANGDLVLTWRTVDRTDKDRNILFAMRSSNGKNWGQKWEMYRAPTSGTNAQVLAQCLIWTGTAWRLYAVRTRSGARGALSYTETTAERPTTADWSEWSDCDLGAGPDSGQRVWHPDVQKHGDEWIAIMHCTPLTNTQNGDIYLMRSDDGIRWDMSPMPLIPKQGKIHDSMYKTGFVPKGHGVDLELDVFYSAYRSPNADWHIYRSTATKLEK